MSKGIKLSPKYGVNPTLAVCAWCGEDRGDIALLGKIGDGRKGEDIEAPKRMVIDYEPCDSCKAQWAQGVAVIEVQHYPMQEGQPSIAKDAYPTGRVVVVRAEALNGDFKAGAKVLMRADEFRAAFEGYLG